MVQQVDFISMGCFESESLAVQFSNSTSSRTESKVSSDPGKGISLMNYACTKLLKKLGAIEVPRILHVDFFPPRPFTHREAQMIHDSD